MAERGRLTTHVLDTAHGCPAAGMGVRLFGATDALLAETVTNADGRCAAALLEADALTAGRYRLEFAVADYFRRKGVKLAEPPFFDVVAISFAIADAAAHTHIPLLVSPYAYSTYRGS